MTGAPASPEGVLERLAAAPDKGDLLERVLEEALPDLGFEAVHRQASGTQFGFDLIAHRPLGGGKQPEVWKFECKNLARRLSVADVAPKLVWHIKPATLDRLVFVDLRGPSNDLRQLLESNPLSVPIELWSGACLASRVLQSPRALRALGLDAAPAAPPATTGPMVFRPTSRLSLDLVHHHDPPGEFDFLPVGETALKTFTDADFRLWACVTNGSAGPAHVLSLQVETKAYRPWNGRVLRLVKPKGVFEPPELLFKPSRRPGARRELMKSGRAIQLAARDTQVLVLPLDPTTPPGLYEFFFRARGHVDGRGCEVFSGRFQVHIQSPDCDLLQLWVMGRHYEEPVQELLDLPAGQWDRLKELSREPDSQIYLGPTWHEVMLEKPDDRWLIRRFPVEPRPDGSANFKVEAPSTPVLELETPLRQPHDTLKDMTARVEANGALLRTELLEAQFARRGSTVSSGAGSRSS